MKKSSMINVVCKSLAMIISLVYAPVLLEYLDVEKYGIWMTISSTIGWILTFDIGIGNGLRNRLVEALEKGKYIKSKKLVSTAYIGLTMISIIMFLIICLVSQFIDWSNFFETNLLIEPTIICSTIVVCVTLVLSLINTISFSMQKSENVAIRAIIVQLVNLIFIFILSKLRLSNDELFLVALVTGVSSICVYIIYSIIVFSKLDYLRPSLRFFDSKELKNICSVGLMFFFIQIVGLIMYSTDNLLITKIIDNEHVTSYSMAYKVYGVAFAVFCAILSPLWSKVTQAKVNSDYGWIKRTIKKMLLIWGVFSVVLLFSIMFYEPITEIWLQKKLEYDNGLILSMIIYFILYMYSGIFSSVLNGLGVVKAQMPIAVVSAVLNIPLSVLLATTFNLGSTGICLGTVITLVFGDVVMTIMVKKELKRGSIE